MRVGEQPTSDGDIVAIFSDLTQLKLRETALAESEQRFRDFTQAASDWVWELDADLRFTSVSGRYTEVSGRSPDFLIGKKMTDVPSLVQDSDSRAVLDAFDRKLPFHNRRFTRPNDKGELFHFLCSGIPVFPATERSRAIGEQGRISPLLCTPKRAHAKRKNNCSTPSSRFPRDSLCSIKTTAYVCGIPGRRIFCRPAENLSAPVTDVTAERTAVAALEESEERYRQLVESSPDSITIHQKGRLIFVNPAGARLFGVSSPDELIGRRVLDFIHPDQHVLLRTTEPTVKAGGGNTPFFEFRALREDGTEFDVEGVSLEFTYSGEPATLGIIRDITLRKLAQAQLVQASKLATLGELAAGITHELNQPLNVIRLAADSSLILMEEDKTDREFEIKQFERISAHASRMSKIISHMRTFSRREDDEGDHDLINPLESVTAAILLVHEQFARDDVHIEVELPDSLCLVYGNLVRLEQVILNLLTNARDAMVLEQVDPQSGRTFKSKQSGHILISLRFEMHDADNPDNRQNCNVIRIDDNGGGIPADVLDRVFDPFFTTKRTGQGTGLGLAIGYNIVDSMDGRIVASNGLEGARFEVWLPVAEELDIAEPLAQAAPSDKAKQTTVVS